ncbi:MAG: MGH1-like glycoside hydrolase domain-containing protein [Anaerorhabdus sp.]
MKKNQPKWYHLKYNRINTQINRLLKRSYSGKTGIYFKGDNNYESILSYDDVKDKLPIPILENEKHLIRMYDHVWERVFNAHMQPANPKVNLLAPYIDVGLDNKLYQWDMFFIIQYAKYINHLFPSIQSLDNFYLKQREDGMIHRIYCEKTGKEHWWGSFPNTINPPLFSWCEFEYIKLSGNSDRIAKILAPLEAYSNWILDNMVIDKSKHQLFWNTGDASGMDNTTRGGNGWIDMSSQVVCDNLSLSKLYKLNQDDINSEKHLKIANDISNKIDKWMWCEEDGMYYDVDNNGNQIKVKTIASFWPLLSGIISKEKADKLVKHLKNEDEFWSDMVFPSLAKSEVGYDPSGKYWRGGVWSPTNYMVIKGLNNYGYDQLAYDASKKYLDGMYEVFEDTNTIWEAYSPEPFKNNQLQPCTKKDGKNFCKDDFLGWSGIGPVALLIENIIGINVDSFNNLITWKIIRDDVHGIKNLHVNNCKVDLVVSGKSDARTVEIESNREFKLIIHYNSKEIKKNILVGTNKFTI